MVIILVHVVRLTLALHVAIHVCCEWCIENERLVRHTYMFLCHGEGHSEWHRGADTFKFDHSTDRVSACKYTHKWTHHESSLLKFVTYEITNLAILVQTNSIN